MLQVKSDVFDSGVAVTDTDLFIDGRRRTDWHFEETVLEASSGVPHTVCVASAGGGGSLGGLAGGWKFVDDIYVILRDLGEVSGEDDDVSAEEEEWRIFQEMDPVKPF